MAYLNRSFNTDDILIYLNIFRLIFERREVASIPWASVPQVAVMLTLVLSQIIFYLLFPVSGVAIIITAERLSVSRPFLKCT